MRKDRLRTTFMDLIRINSPSLKEKTIADYIYKLFEGIGLSAGFDSARKVIGGDTGNLIVRFPGDESLPAIMLSAHLDTVGITENIVPVIEGDIIRSDGTTILGADDKSGIACIIETMRVIIENEIPHPSIDIVFTVSEEIGLLGAKNLDYSMIDAKMGYALDSESPFAVILGAPYQNTISVNVYGKEAHAGANPSSGINAIKVSADAISKIDVGQIDEETTANIGIIKGGTATNIVPGFVEIKAEVRSHNEAKIERKTRDIVSKFEESIPLFKKEIDGKTVMPEVRYDIKRDYNAFRVGDDEDVVRRVFDAASLVGMEIETRMGGGGSDANIFNEKGIRTVVLGTGMKKVHTKDEYISMEDMVTCTELLLGIVRC